MIIPKMSFGHFINRQKIKMYGMLKGREINFGKSLRIKKDDVFLVSYPRCGNTWMRFVLGSLIHNVDVNFDNMEEYFPDIYRNTNAQLESIGFPRYLKSHEPYDNRYPKVIYLVRDPRDIAISYYYWMLKFNKFDGDFDRFLDFFFRRDSIAYGRWDDHYNGWIKNSTKVPHGLLILRYEDLMLNTVENIKKILSFLNLSVEDDAVEKVVKKNSISNMKVKEKSISNENSLFKDTDKDIPFVRKGEIGQWKNELTEEQLQRFEKNFCTTMERIDYI